MRTKKVLLCVLALMVALMAMSVPAFAAGNVAKIGTTEYATLEAAFAAAQDGDTITLLANSSGNGIKVPQGTFATGLTVDFAGYTYTVDGQTVGSTGTETNGFQLLKDNKITFQNGTITSTKAKILIQNYSNLTVDNMTLTLNNPNYSGAYTLSNNNGNIVIDDTTINANPAGGFAFDVCRYASYPSVNVTVTGNSAINGDVEVSASGSDAKDGFSLTLESGEMSGNVVIDSSAATAMAATPEKAAVTQDEDFKVYVAAIGATKYETLEAAFAAAQDGDTINVLADCEGNGIKVTPAGKFANGLTVDFGGHTYAVTGTPVGSTGTETIGFQLLKDNKITFANGTITGNSNTNTALQRMIQNYSDLTLDNMTVSMVGRYYDQSTVSTCNGEFVVKDSTVSAPDFTWANISDPSSVGGVAFTVGTFASYTSASAEVKGSSTINGDISVDPSNDATNALILTSGTVTGDILMASEQAADATVTKADTFTQEAPAGYEWVDKGNGTAELTPVPPAAASVTITKKDAYVDYDGLGYLRFVSTVNVAAGNTVEYFGTWFIPENLLNDTTKEKATVTYNTTIENGKSFTADLLGIPHEALIREIAGVSFVKVSGQSEVSTDVATANILDLKNYTSAE